MGKVERVVSSNEAKVDFRNKKGSKDPEKEREKDKERKEKEEKMREREIE
jgi:hypothetical protein